jgi:cell wall-associated NlpC family hydrolase
MKLKFGGFVKSIKNCHSERGTSEESLLRFHRRFFFATLIRMTHVITFYRTIKFGFLVGLIWRTTILAQSLPQEILFVPWGAENMGNVEFTSDPDGRFGPQNFQVVGDTVYLLDQQHRVIHRYLKNKHIGHLQTLREARDFIIRSGDDYVCLANNALYFYKDGKVSDVVRQKGPLPLICKITRQGDDIIAVNHDGTAARVQGRQLARMSSKGIPVIDNRYRLRKISRSAAEVTVLDNQGKQKANILLDIPSGNLGSFELAGVDRKGTMYLDLSLILQEIPLKVRREVWMISPEGTITGKIHIPTHYFTRFSNDLRVTETGNIYHMISSEDGIRVLKWTLDGKADRFFEGVYPEKFQKYLHYNDSIKPDNGQKKSFGKITTLTTVTRSEALAIGDSYAVHEWSCTSANLTGPSGVTASDGLLIITPSWIQPGDNVRVPYKWGGFSTLPDFDAGLLNGKYAGDRYTGKSSGSRDAVGVDCSGFVSRCWKLNTHYSTWMMSNTQPLITQPYNSWDDLKPGDAIHMVGHVRLAVDNLAGGSILAVEAAGGGTDWRVNYRTYKYSQLEGYLPRYYINMSGPSIPLAQPVLLSATRAQKAAIDWSLSSVQNVDGIELNYSIDGVNWESLLGDSLIPPDIKETLFEWDNEPFFVKLQSVNTAEGRVASLPSDTYGFYLPPGYSQKILIVDGFDRASGSWGMPYHPFALWMGQALCELHVPFETATNEAVINGSINLSDYRAIYWILGDESTADETFSTAEQNLVREYLKNGGRLFVSGSEIAWDLDYKGSINDRSFFLNYLHAGYVADDAKSYQVVGTAAGVFTGLSFEFDDGSGGIYQEDYPDVINLMMNAVTCLKYSSGTIAGIQYEGIFLEGTVPGKLVYLAFPWETITDDNQKQIVLMRISEYFGFIEPETAAIPDKPWLSHGYPNPFNNRVNFRIILPSEQDFSINIYNISGGLVRSIDRPEPGGKEYTISWNGTNDDGQTVASGCYFFRVVLPDQALTRKIMFLK